MLLRYVAACTFIEPDKMPLLQCVLFSNSFVHLFHLVNLPVNRIVFVADAMYVKVNMNVLYCLSSWSRYII